MSEDNDHAIVPEWDLDSDTVSETQPEPEPGANTLVAQTSTYEQTSTNSATKSTTSYVDGKYFLYLFVGIVLMVVSGFALYYIMNHRDEIIAAAASTTSK